MPARLLTSPTVFGLFGKLPAAGDFLRLNLGTAATTLDDWLASGFAALETRQPLWRDGFAHAPGWRVALARGIAGPQAFAGAMAPSRDGAGRCFPCLALASAGDAAPERLAADTAWFDAVEDALRSAIASPQAPQSLTAELETFGAPRVDVAGDFVVKTRQTPDGGFVDVEGGPDPCGEALGAAWEVAPPPPDASLWWRRERAHTRVVIAAGLPRGDAFAALFHVAASAPPHAA